MLLNRSREISLDIFKWGLYLEEGVGVLGFILIYR